MGEIRRGRRGRGGRGLRSSFRLGRGGRRGCGRLGSWGVWLVMCGCGNWVGEWRWLTEWTACLRETFEFYLEEDSGA